MRKHLPRKKTDTNIMRCILLNINDNTDTTACDYGIDNGRFKALLGALLSRQIIMIYDFSTPDHTAAYVIYDKEKYERWKQNDFYDSIKKYVLPSVMMGAEVLSQLTKK